ncbi:kinase-like protein [Dendrothele bispora CBS 962.96]|uniref:Kinase-like protein n=1 Tax=Dendrothele bispora (strain CBS 962.96) TaxID=1314807 RepID=A0A4S8KIH2_DENBC|nr:kinase-like protein [Dendrothele bispora CBS 962.96]
METLQSQYAQLPPNDSLLRLQTTASFDVVLTDEGPLQRAFPSVPEELLSIPQAFIDDLTYTSTLTSHVDLVKLSEGTVKVFKRYPPIPPSHDALLPEALVLAAVESAQILKPTHVVVSRHGDDMYFRGFLMPYLSHGTLAEYLGSNTLDWATKIRWAIQIAAGVSSLHCRGFYCGDIRLENILISDDQKDVVLIDVGPVPALVPPYTPPEVVGSQLLTGPRDIYAVGIILAAFVLGNGEAKYPDDNDLADAPDPYRTIVLECLDCDPLKRPTPEKLVDALKSCDEVPVL